MPPRSPGPDPRLSRWIRRTLSADPPRVPSLIVTVWGDALAPHGGAVWLAGLIRLMAPFGVNERAVRTGVFRLARDGWLAAAAAGRRSRYRLTPEGARRFAQAYRRIYAPPAPLWDGEWELVMVPPDRVSALARRRLREELGWEGFGTFGPGIWGRPAHGESAMPRIARALGVADRVTAVKARDDLALGGHPLAACVAEAWDLDTLAKGYCRFLARFRTVADSLCRARAADPEQAFVVRTLLIHAFRRVLLRDPQLPPELLPPDWPGAAAYALTREVYLRTQKTAERHLRLTLGETLPAASDEFHERFGGIPR